MHNTQTKMKKKFIIFSSLSLYFQNQYCDKKIILLSLFKRTMF